LGLRLAGFRAAEWVVKPMYYLRTKERRRQLVPISEIGTRPILFISGERDEICPPENAKLMFEAALSPEKRLLVVPEAEHDATYQTAPRLYEIDGHTVPRRRVSTSCDRTKQNTRIPLSRNASI